jgi:hypothetical protein
MKFDNIINSLLKEEDISKEDRLRSLKSLVGLKRTFDVFYKRYERHEDVPAEKYVVSGRTLWDALGELPEHVLDDVLYDLDEEDVEAFQNDEESLINCLNDIDIGGFSYLTIYENGKVLVGVEGEEEEEEEEEDISKEDRLRALNRLKDEQEKSIRIGSKVRVKDDVDGGMAGEEGFVVSMGEDEDGDDSSYGVMWEVEFDNGMCEYVMDCDLDLIK